MIQLAHLWTAEETLGFLQGVRGLGALILGGLFTLLVWYIACRWGLPWKRKASGD
ncbi:MAG: hypothetical protein V3S82_05245 [Dehalococcoidia bacterium]